MSASLDRWFFAGIGFVKETTVVRGPTGGLLQRATLELQKRPEVVAKPEVAPTPTAAVAAPSPSERRPFAGRPSKPILPLQARN